MPGDLFCLASGLGCEGRFVQLFVKAYDNPVFQAKGGRAQVAGGAHGRFEDRLFVGLGGLPVHRLFAPGRDHQGARGEDGPGGVGVDALFARVGDLFRGEVQGPKKLLGAVAGRSAFSEVCPFNHAFFLIECGVNMGGGNPKGGKKGKALEGWLPLWGTDRRSFIRSIF